MRKIIGLFYGSAVEGSFWFKLVFWVVALNIALLLGLMVYELIEYKFEGAAMVLFQSIIVAINWVAADALARAAWPNFHDDEKKASYE